MKVDINNIGLRLQDYRKSIGISQKVLSQKTGIERTYLSRVENGMPPSFDFLVKLAKSFDLSIDWLLSGEGPMLFQEKRNLLNIVDRDYLELIEKLSSKSEEKKRKFIPIFIDILKD